MEQEREKSKNVGSMDETMYAIFASGLSQHFFESHKKFKTDKFDVDIEDVRSKLGNGTSFTQETFDPLFKSIYKLLLGESFPVTNIQIPFEPNYPEFLREKFDTILNQIWTPSASTSSTPSASTSSTPSASTSSTPSASTSSTPSASTSSTPSASTSSTPSASTSSTSFEEKVKQEEGTLRTFAVIRALLGADKIVSESVHLKKRIETSEDLKYFLQSLTRENLDKKYKNYLSFKKGYEAFKTRFAERLVELLSVFETSPHSDFNSAFLQADLENFQHFPKFQFVQELLDAPWNLPKLEDKDVEFKSFNELFPSISTAYYFVEHGEKNAVHFLKTYAELNGGKEVGFTVDSEGMIFVKKVPEGWSPKNAEDKIIE
jgi:hypothetical protein